MDVFKRLELNKDGQKGQSIKSQDYCKSKYCPAFFFFFKARDIFIKNLIKQSVVGRAVKH